MLQTIATVASFAFQISGAIILLLWYLTNSDKKIKQMCLDEHDGPLWGSFGKLGITTVLSKNDLQTKAKTFYQNTFAFVDILIGYTCAIFADSTTLCPCCIFTFVVVATVIILGIEILLSKKLAKANYPSDQRVKLDDSELKPGTTAIKTIKPSDNNPS